MVFIRGFLLLSVLLNAAGWMLSAAGMLNRSGYTLLFILTAIVLITVVKWRDGEWKRTAAVIARKWRSRFRRPFPLTFLIFVGIIVASGVLFEPNHNDAVSFRIPRLLHWISAQRWHWIETVDARMNIRAAGFEWMALPGLLWTGSSRSIFLINLLAYLCVPGLIFGMFRRLGVNWRVAWYWMWILPSAYGLVLNASNAGVDLLLVVYALAALGFALHAAQEKSFNALAFSILAAALMTGTKQTSGPLLLPWLVAIIPAWPVAWRHRGKLAAVLVVALLISAAPISWMNWQYAGDWSGLVLDRGFKANTSPLLNLPGNIVLLVVQNLVPPLFIGREIWVNWAHSWQTTPLGEVFARNFEWGFLWLPYRLNATMSALGPGITVLLLISCAYHLWHWRRQGRLSGQQRAVMRATAIMWFALLTHTSMWQSSRLFLPHCFYLIPFFLTGVSQAGLVRQRWWQRLALIAIGHVVLALLFIASRSPLAAVGVMPDFFITREVPTVESTAWVQKQIPAEEKVVGICRSYVDAETWLWEPHGSRVIVALTGNESAVELDRRKIRYLVFSSLGMEENGFTLEEWLVRHHAELVSEITISYHPWYLVRRK